MPRRAGSREPGFGQIAPSSGDFQTVVEEPTNFVLTATNAKGSVTGEVFVDGIGCPNFNFHRIGLGSGHQNEYYLGG